MDLSMIHERLANTAVLYIIIVGIWMFWRFFRGEGVDGSVWGALLIAEGLILVQGVLGGVLWLQGLRPERDWIHILYGISSAIMIPGIFAWTRGESDRRVTLVYGAALLFLAGLLFRAIQTGASPI